MAERRGSEQAARIRAARAWADLKRSELGNEIGVSERQVTRLESGTATAGHELRTKIADVCGVPPLFLELGWGPLAGDADDAAGTGAFLVAALHEVQARLDDVELRLRRSADAAPESPPGELLQPPEDAPTTGDSARGAATGRGRGTRRGTGR